MKRILEAKILQNRVVQLRFDDGLEGTVDFGQYPSTGVFRRWEDPEFFAEMAIDHNLEHLCPADPPPVKKREHRKASS